MALQMSPKFRSARPRSSAHQLELRAWQVEEFTVPIQVRAERVSGAWREATRRRGGNEAPRLFPLDSPVALPRSPARHPLVAREERGTPRAFTLTATPDRNLIERRGCSEWAGVLGVLRFTSNRVLEFSLMDHRRTDF